MRILVVCLCFAASCVPLQSDDELSRKYNPEVHGSKVSDAMNKYLYEGGFKVESGKSPTAEDFEQYKYRELADKYIRGAAVLISHKTIMKDYYQIGDRRFVVDFDGKVTEIMPMGKFESISPYLRKIRTRAEAKEVAMLLNDLLYSTMWTELKEEWLSASGGNPLVVEGKWTFPEHTMSNYGCFESTGFVKWRMEVNPDGKVVSFETDRGTIR